MTTTLPELEEQLRQLQSLHAAGTLDDAAYGRARAEVERRVVARVAGEAGAPAGAGGARPWRLWASAATTVLTIAVAGYAWTGMPKAAWNASQGSAGPPQVSLTPAGGGPGAARPWGRSQLAATAPAAGASAPGRALAVQRVEAMVNRLAEHLQSSPDDAEGWAMLARSLTVLGRHEQALPAYERARALHGDDAALLADHADALAVAQGRRMSGEPMALVRRALQLDPDNLKALSLAGTDAFERADYSAAVTHWEHARRVAPSGSPYLAQLQSGIEEARSLGGATSASVATAAAPSASTPAAAPPSARITGTVSLATALKSQVRPEDTVFVFARAVQGSRMPVAIMRRQVRDLPFDFTLDDASAMSPAQRLSSLPQATVIARVSRSGNAALQPGDLIGELSPVALGTRGLKLEISRVAER